MLGLTNRSNKSIFNIAEKIIKFELFTNTFDDFLLAKLKDKLEEILKISDITPQHLQFE